MNTEPIAEETCPYTCPHTGFKCDCEPTGLCKTIEENGQALLEAISRLERQEEEEGGEEAQEKTR